MNNEAVRVAERPDGTVRSGGAARQVVILAVVLVLGLGMAYYYEGILIPLRESAVRAAGVATGYWSDLYPLWLGGRELLWHGRNPYSPEMTQEIQRGFYGQLVDRSKGGDFRDPRAFAYPVYVVFLLLPFLHFSFDSVRIVFTAILLLLTAASLPLWLRVFRVRLRIWAVVLAMIATLSSYPVVDGLHLQQMTLLVGALLAASLAALVSGRLVLAGMLLALGSIKPQLVIFVVAFLLVWTVGAWRSRKSFAVGFGATVAALLIASELVLPGWFRYWWQEIHAYAGYVKPSLLRTLLGQSAAVVVSAIAVLLCGALFWRVRKGAAGSDGFNIAIVTALLVTVTLLPNAGGSKYNQVLLISAVIWLLIRGWRLAKSSRLAHVLWLLAVNVLVWQWILAAIVCFAVVIMHKALQSEATPFVAGPELLVFLFPLALAPFVLYAALLCIRRPRFET